MKSFGKYSSKGSLGLVVVLIISLLLLIAGYFIFTNVVLKNTHAIQTSTSLAPTNPPTDFAPNLPMNQKTTVIIRQSDSSTTTYLIPNSQVDTFTNKLPEGSTIVSKTRN